MSAARNTYENIVDDIRRQILSGELAPGAALPTGRALCERYGVSRQTIGTAMVVLRTHGLIVGQRGKGVYVTADHRTIKAAAQPPDSANSSRIPQQCNVLAEPASREAEHDDAAARAGSGAGRSQPGASPWSG